MANRFTVIPRNRPISIAFYDAHVVRRTYSRLKPQDTNGVRTKLENLKKKISITTNNYQLWNFEQSQGSCVGYVSGIARRRKVEGTHFFLPEKQKKKKKKKKKVTVVLKRKIGSIVDRRRAYNLMHFLLNY